MVGFDFKDPEWSKAEHYIQTTLGLDKTISSGNKFYDPGDAVSSGHPRDTPYPLLIDSKTTLAEGYRVPRKTLTAWNKKAAEWGKAFALHIRFLVKNTEKGGYSHEDYILMKVLDFEEIYDSAKKWTEHQKSFYREEF